MAKYDGYKTDIGKRILSGDGSIAGTITNVVNRWCRGCQWFGPVYSVKWDDETRTFPCPAGCKLNNEGILQIKWS